MSLDERVPLDSDVWKIVRLHGIGLEQLDIYWHGAIQYLELRWKKHVFKAKRDAIAYDLRREGYTVRMTGKLSSNSSSDVKRELNAKFYSLWLERLKTAGMRDPADPFKTISPDDPRTKREIQRIEIELAFAKGEIDLEEYHKRYEFLETSRLENKLFRMQYDKTLSWKQRKVANEKIKEIITQKDYPRIPKHVYEEAIEQVLTAK